jgi:hypothetical protein
MILRNTGGFFILLKPRNYFLGTLKEGITNTAEEEYLVTGCYKMGLCR